MCKVKQLVDDLTVLCTLHCIAELLLYFAQCCLLYFAQFCLLYFEQRCLPVLNGTACHFSPHALPVTSAAARAPEVALSAECGTYLTGNPNNVKKT